MSALTSGRNTARRELNHIAATVDDGSTVYAGGMITLLTADGTAVPAGTASAGNVVGVAETTVTGDGTLTVSLGIGCYRFDNSASTDEIKAADVGAIAYIVDDQTVAKTDNSGARKIAGAIAAVDDIGVWVQVGPGAVGPKGDTGAAP